MEISVLISKVNNYINRFDPSNLIKAWEFTKKAHQNQYRASGEPYYIHPLAVAIILAGFHLDEDSLITALLHDTVEDTDVTIEDIRIHFGENVAKLVDGVTKLDKLKFQSEEIRQGDNFRKLLLAMSEDIRVLIIKLADRLHNMRTLEYLSEKKAERNSIETLEIYAPLAERIGMQKIKNELQDLAFARLHPEIRASILSRLEYLKKDGGSMVDKIERHIQETLSDSGIKAEVRGREKTPFSIWQKMKQKNICFEQLSDIIAFRVIVDDLSDCYQVLGIIHAAYQMVPGTFKDYISTPKDNGYSSLHTVVMGPDKQKIEVQIRTFDMDKVNEIGVAAHWSYKQNVFLGNSHLGGKEFRWVRDLIKIMENSDYDEYIENTRIEMYEDQVFCFSPKGRLFSLPRGATPIDFAYAVHSDLGNTCAGCKINGRVLPLYTKLENGDQVEIIVSKTQTPSIGWEKFVVTAKAKAEIKKRNRLQQRKEFENLGKGIVQNVLIQLNKELNEDEVKKMLQLFPKKNIDDFYFAVGEGSIRKEEIYNCYKSEKLSKLKKLKDSLSFFNFVRKKKQASISIKGPISGKAIKLGACCNPIPGDQIIGVFDEHKKAITVHQQDCETLAEFPKNSDRLIEVFWHSENKEIMHNTRIKIVLANTPNTLATITAAIAEYKCNISNIKMVTRTEDVFELFIDLEVRGITQLSNILASLRSKECIYSVDRVKD